MRTRGSLTCAIALIVVAAFTGSSRARIDPSTVVGAWLFDEGPGDKAEHSSRNGHDGKIVHPAKWIEGKFDATASKPTDSRALVPGGEEH